MKKQLLYYGLWMLFGVLLSCSHADAQVSESLQLVINTFNRKSDASTEQLDDIKRMISDLMKEESQSQEERHIMRDMLSVLVYNDKNTTQKLPEVNLTGVNQSLPRDCKDLLLNGIIQNGVYKIYPEGFPEGVDVYCDQEAYPPGWTIAMQFTAETPFKSFQEYADGYGDPHGDFFIGNRVLHYMTKNRPHLLRFEIDFSFIAGYFTMGSEETQYTVEAKPFLGNVTTMMFSTLDKDNEGGCASKEGRVGWFTADCTKYFLLHFKSRGFRGRTGQLKILPL